MAFINISNHLSSTWSEEQVQKAKELGGTIIDYPFPEVEPEASEEEIITIATKILEDIKSKVGEEELCKSVILVQGEFSLTVALVSMLKQIGIKVVCATTKRVVKHNPDGSITRYFSFVKFRQYVLPSLAEKT